MINANNPALTSWVEVNKNSDFPIQNLPFGVFSLPNQKKRVGVAIGEYILDLEKTASLGFFASLPLDSSVFSQEILNPFIELGRPIWRQVRQRISDLLVSSNSELQAFKEQVLVRQSDATMHLPVRITDYTDFYSSIEHATNVGTMFRDPSNALLPNWKHIPVGYHGRASSIVISGTEIRRPNGQTKNDNDENPTFGPSRLVDFELEMAFIVGKSTQLGQTVKTNQVDDYIFGFTLFNDWSARDIQKWEYVPLGPFLAKNFGSSMSPWIVTLDALEPFRVEGPVQDVEVLPYLKVEGKNNFDINLQVAIQPEGKQETVVCNSNFKYMYWNVNQQLAHHTSNGCNINVGDLYASGTISGKDKTSYGSMLELTWRGQNPIQMNDGSERKFILDNDTVIMRGWAQNGDVRIGFGEVSGKILPAL